MKQLVGSHMACLYASPPPGLTRFKVFGSGEAVFWDLPIYLLHHSNQSVNYYVDQIEWEFQAVDVYFVNGSWGQHKFPTFNESCPTRRGNYTLKASWM